MGFKVLVRDENNNVQVVHEISDRRVTRVGFSTNEGEGGGILITPHQTEVLLTFDYVHNDGRPNLQDLEAMEHPERTGEEAEAAAARLAKLSSATNTGTGAISFISSSEEQVEGVVEEEVQAEGSSSFSFAKTAEE